MRALVVWHVVDVVTRERLAICENLAVDEQAQGAHQAATVPVVGHSAAVVDLSCQEFDGIKRHIALVSQQFLALHKGRL